VQLMKQFTQLAELPAAARRDQDLPAISHPALRAADGRARRFPAWPSRASRRA
jgi:hypothetical protein